MRVHRALLETKHFTFEAFGDTARHARVALLKGLSIHGKVYKLPANWYEEDIPDIAETSFELGSCYRGASRLA